MTSIFICFPYSILHILYFIRLFYIIFIIVIFLWLCWIQYSFFHWLSWSLRTFMSDFYFSYKMFGLLLSFLLLHFLAVLNYFRCCFVVMCICTWQVTSLCFPTGFPYYRCLHLIWSHNINNFGHLQLLHILYMSWQG